MDLPEIQNRKTIQAAQLSKLRSLINACLSGNAFYAERIKQAGIDASLKSIAEFTDSLEFTTKDQLADAHAVQPPFRPNLPFPLEG